MHEQELRQHRCCFTGHRPEKLNISEEQLCVRLGLEIDRAIEDGFTTFISGMAKGVDICAAELVLKRRVSRKIQIGNWPGSLRIRDSPVPV